MTTPFVYPPAPHVRCHGPLGYADTASFRPWLRDEFSFRCVYCLLREQWCRVRGIYDIEHHLPIVLHAGLALDYENLLYACATCNATKGSREVADPLVVLTNSNVHASEDGMLHAFNSDAARLIRILGLNSKQSVEFRLLWIGIIALAAKYETDLYRQLMGYPSDLPDLQMLQPPDGNSRPDGVTNCFHAQRTKGMLPATY
jgi:hypothetical protein